MTVKVSERAKYNRNKIADYNVRVKPENDCSNYCKDVRTETKDTTVTLCDNENSFTWDMPGYKSKPVSLEGNATQQEFKDTLRTKDDLCDSIIYILSCLTT